MHFVHLHNPRCGRVVYLIQLGLAHFGYLASPIRSQLLPIPPLSNGEREGDPCPPDTNCNECRKPPLRAELFPDTATAMLVHKLHCCPWVLVFRISQLQAVALRPRSALPLRGNASLLNDSCRVLQIKQLCPPAGHPVPCNRANTF